MLRRDGVPDWLWSELSETGALELPEDQLLRETRRRLRAIRAKTTRPARRPRAILKAWELLAPAEAQRAWGFSEYIAGLAAADPDLQRFRSTHLDDRTLTREEASQFLASEPLCYLPASVLRSKGVPLWGHTVLKCETESGPAQHTLRDGRSVPMWRLAVHIEISWGDESATFDPWLESSPGSPPLPKLHLPTGDQWYEHTVWRGSVYDELGKVRDRLVEQFPWNEPEATNYIVTGETPFIAPVHVQPSGGRHSFLGHSSFAISVEPWISAQTVTRFYKHLQGGAYPGRSRALGARNLALFRFVTQHAKPGMEVPSYEELVRLWNASHPRWKYKSAWLLARDYRRAGDSIVFPGSRLVGKRRRVTSAAKEGRRK